MTDMLVKLYALPEVTPHLITLNQKGVEIRRPHPSEKYVLAEWVRQHFQESWAVGCEVALAHRPVSCYIAVEKSQVQVPSNSPYDLPAKACLAQWESKRIIEGKGLGQHYYWHVFTL